MRNTSLIWALVLGTGLLGSAVKAETPQEQTTWLLKLAATYQNKAFCISPTATVNMVMRSFSDYALAHGMSYGGDAGAVAILAKLYPCAEVTQWQLWNAPVAQLNLKPGHQTVVKPEDARPVAAQTDADTLTRLDAATGEAQNALVDQLVPAPDRQSPPDVVHPESNQVTGPQLAVDAVVFDGHVKFNWIVPPKQVPKDLSFSW